MMSRQTSMLVYVGMYILYIYIIRIYVCSIIRSLYCHMIRIFSPSARSFFHGIFVFFSTNLCISCWQDKEKYFSEGCARAEFCWVFPTRKRRNERGNRTRKENDPFLEKAKHRQTNKQFWGSILVFWANR